MNPTTTTEPAGSPLATQAERDAEQGRVNALATEDAASLRGEIVRAAERAHASFPQYEGHWQRWFLGRMTEDHEAAASEVHAGDLVLYIPTPKDRHGSPFTAYAIRAGVDVMLPAEAAETLVRAFDDPPRVEGAPGNPDLVSNVSIDGVVVGSVTRLAEDSFVCGAYPTTAGDEYTIGGYENVEEAVAAVHAEFEAGWERC